jgi:hypothetical protein
VRRASTFAVRNFPERIAPAPLRRRRGTTGAEHDAGEVLGPHRAMAPHAPEAYRMGEKTPPSQPTAGRHPQTRGADNQRECAGSRQRRSCQLGSNAKARRLRSARPLVMAHSFCFAHDRAWNTRPRDAQREFGSWPRHLQRASTQGQARAIMEHARMERAFHRLDLKARRRAEDVRVSVAPAAPNGWTKGGRVSETWAWPRLSRLSER